MLEWNLSVSCPHCWEHYDTNMDMLAPDEPEISVWATCQECGKGFFLHRMHFVSTAFSAEKEERVENQ